MPSPIEPLRGNILATFEQPNGQRHATLIEAVRNGLISAEIAIDGTDGPPRAPKAIQPAMGPAFLQLHLTHMELLWCSTYGWMILYEEGVQRPMIDHTWAGHIVLDSPLKERAANLLKWSSSLRTRFTRWPAGHPCPSGGADAAETEFCFKANNVFCNAVSFLLYHEFAHVQQGHFRVHDPRDNPQAHALALDLEREADDYAYSVFVSATDTEERRAELAWPLLMPLLSSLYLVDGLVGVFQRRHPHLHHRIRHMLDRLDLREGRYADYYKFLCAVVLSVFSNAHARGGDEAPLEPEVFLTTEEALDGELDFLDRAEPN